MDPRLVAAFIESLGPKGAALKAKEKPYPTPAPTDWEGYVASEVLQGAPYVSSHGKELNRMKERQMMEELARLRGMDSRELSLEGSRTAFDQRIAYPGAWQDFNRQRVGAYQMAQMERRPDSPENLARRYPSEAAKKLQSMGQNGDTLLAHINPQEAALLEALGGAAQRHPQTGLLQFFDPEGNADASRADGTAGYEGQGGFGGPEYGGPAGGGKPGEERMAQAYSQQPLVGTTTTPMNQNFLGQMLGSYNSLNPIARGGINAATGGYAGIASALAGLFGYDGWSGGTVSADPSAHANNVMGNQSGTAGPGVFGGRDGWDDDLWGNGRQSSYVGTNR